MKKINKYLLFPTLILSLSLTACSNKAEHTKLPNESLELVGNLEENSNQVNLTNLEELYSHKLDFIMANDIDPMDYIDENQKIDDFMELIGHINTQGRTFFSDDISKEDAIHDIDLIFELLEVAYGGYKPNGGKEAFDEAKSKVIASLPEKINTRNIEDLLREELAFTKDNSLIFGPSNSIEVKWLHDKNIKISKDENGYYELLSGNKIVNVNEIEAYLKASLTETGQLAYGLYAFEGDELPSKLSYEDGTSRNLTFENIKPTNLSNIEHSFNDEKIPYLNLRSFPTDDKSEDMETLRDSVRKLSQADLGILDLRSNMNSSPLDPAIIFKDLTGEDMLISSYNISIMDASIYGKEFWEEYLQFLNPEQIAPNHVLLRPSDTSITRNSKLIVLIDQYTMNYAEVLVDALHHVENTLFIGTPTTGFIGNPASYGGTLDKTKLYLSFGSNWNIYDENYYKDSRGFQPDIWAYNIDENKLIEILSKIK